MTLWLILAGLGLAAAALLAWALLRGAAAAGERAEYDLQVLRAQIKELDRERELGLVSAEDAAAARLEIERRILIADAARGQGPVKRLGSAERIAAVAISLMVPAAAFGAYLYLGAPEVPGVPHAERPAVAQGQAGGAPGAPDVATMVARLEQRLADNPDDVEGWAILGRSYIVMGRPEDALVALDRAIALNDEVPFLHSARGEALALAAQGIVTPAAREAFGRALALDPDDARARFYLALAREQEGDVQGALDDLVALLETGGPEAPWYEGVYERAAALAGSLGLEAAAVLPAPPAAPPVAPMARAGGDTPADPRAAAEQLAARLAENPRDFEGWIALARLRAGLGDRVGAQEALDRGAATFPGAPFVQQQFREAAVELGLSGGEAGARGPSADDVQAAEQMTDAERDEMIRGMVGNLAARLQDDPDDLEGWRMLARSYGVLGESDKAVEAYAHLAERQPENAAAQLDYARALVERDGGRALAPQTVTTLRRVLELDPRNPDAHFFLGDAAEARGDRAAAKEHFEELLGQLDPDSPEYAIIEDRITALGG